MIAAYYDRSDIVEVLLRHNAALALQDDSGTVFQNTILSHPE